MSSDGPFWRAVAETSAAALASGALQPIATESHTIEDGGVRFLARVVENLARKRLESAEHGNAHDPFLSPAKELVVADVSDTHVAVLNKYNVVDRHVLLVTRAFEEQESILTTDDFDAVWRCLSESDALWFYNAGPGAGASQRHKHLQLVPVPLSGGPERTPIEPVLANDSRGLPFTHAVCRIDEDARAARERYLALLTEVGDPRVYNLLGTREWMLLVPRARASWRGISVNALGFAGALLVRTEDELTELRRIGPMRLLGEVTAKR